MKTRFGDQTGHLERISITVLADDGDSLDVDATVFISGDWPAGNFLGYTGFLERIRTGLDPQENFFYFGPVPSQ
ncbi:MAG: hypothetical protein HYY46_10260 [Deltaproteobacteria bacterium]|nr:hypothetical protein [Deltaproteobacteria bacterium]